MTASASPVYFADMRCPMDYSLLTKMQKLLRAAGLTRMDLAGKFVAIKMHFGEPGNLAFLRPNFAKCVADMVREQGGLPFLTDCSTLYVGRRRHALEHLAAAQENGFSPLSTGCQLLIGDGLRGTDEVEVPVPGGEIFRTARIGRVIMDADVLISLNHFKGHKRTGFGGAIKNVGMGCGSRAGKMAMHCCGKPVVAPEKCRGCGICMRFCGQQAIGWDDGHRAVIDQEACVGCGRCIGACSQDAISSAIDAASDKLNARMAEYAAAVLHGRPHFHISVANNISPCCDCHGGNDAAIVPDIGIFASHDPVALDQACIDAVNAAPVIATSRLGQCRRDSGDCFTDLHPDTHGTSQVEHAERIGLGSRRYELITVSA
ncbi:DUF362 domain-containing protein [uncultured Desulfovibrio sp.]|uniref:DUF362 domain-containing protein n=1 Tax=uncultured Desulfovibrio sp. TaxID=167968 RepID=UPI00262EAF4B|nr:DUF362 domain-containing protein [uncultured Desulfovibrio sp.]